MQFAPPPNSEEFETYGEWIIAYEKWKKEVDKALNTGVPIPHNLMNHMKKENENERTQDKKIKKWGEKNLWMRDNDKMKDYAILIHEKLIEIGIDFLSKKYRTEMDKRMRMQFPKYNWE